MDPDDIDWMSAYQKFRSDPNINLVISQITDFPELDSPEKVELFFKALGDRANSQGIRKEFGTEFGISTRKVGFIMQGLENVLAGQSWESINRGESIKRGGGKIER